MNNCISIIIPVYNVEKYIDRCINSLINQSFKNIEMIFIDDGSTDKSREVIQKYAETDNRIILLTQNHEGVSVARNLGLGKSTGEYIMFCDADDSFTPDACENIAKTLKQESSDICIFGYNIIRNNEIYYSNIKQIIKAKRFSKDFKRRLKLQVYIWNKAFKADFIKQKNLQFAPELSCAEDVVFCTEAIMKGASYSFLPKVLYNYYQDREGNATWNNESCIAKDLQSLKYLVNTEAMQSTDKKTFFTVVNQFIGGTLYYLNIYKTLNAVAEAQNTINWLENNFDKKDLNKIRNYKLIKNCIDSYAKDLSKIDLVYLWCDANDENFKNQREDYASSYNLNEEQNGECRFINNDELKYSLRSVELYAPWINKIYIITNNQTPEWLNTENPKIEIIDQKNILPKNANPCFNSNVIEHSIKNIPGLSYHFLYANDDMFLNKKVTPLTFYTKKGYPVIRHRHLIEEDGSLYNKMLFNSCELILKKFGKSYKYHPHHNFDGYYLPDIVSCYNEFKENLDKCINNHFRQENDIQRAIYDYYSVATGHGKYKELHTHDKELPLIKKLYNLLLNRKERDSVYYSPDCDQKDIAKFIKQYNTMMFCINDTEKVTARERQTVREFLEKRFSEKSSFEL